MPGKVEIWRPKSKLPSTRGSAAERQRGVKGGPGMATPVGIQKMAIPAYFRPTSTDDTDGIPYWTKLQDGRVSIAVMNPFNDAAGESNPDTGDPQQNQAYANTVNETKAAGVRVFGYVTTDRGRVSEDEVT